MNENFAKENMDQKEGMMGCMSISTSNVRRMEQGAGN